MKLKKPNFGDIIVDSHRQFIKKKATCFQDIELVFKDNNSVPYNRLLLALQVPHLQEYLSSAMDADQVIFSAQSASCMESWSLENTSITVEYHNISVDELKSMLLFPSLEALDTSSECAVPSLIDSENITEYKNSAALSVNDARCASSGLTIKTPTKVLCHLVFSQQFKSQSSKKPTKY